MSNSLILHSPPEGVSFTVEASAGTGCEFLTDPADLNNGRPADRTLVRWPTITQTPSIKVMLKAQWDDPQPVRAIVLSDLSCPAGAIIKAMGMRESDNDYTYNLGGNSQSEHVFELADGSFAMVIVCPSSNDDLVGVRVDFYNDDGDSATYMASADTLYIGNVDFYTGYEPPDNVQADWRLTFANVGPDMRSNNVQPWKLKTRQYGVLNVTLSDAPFEVAFGSDANLMYYDRLANILAANDKCGVIVRYAIQDGATLDSYAMHRTAVFGIAENITRPAGQGQSYFTMSFAINEAAPGN